MERKHVHKWVHLSTHYGRKLDGYNVRFKREDEFFCEKCCEIKQVVREGVEYENDPEPMWWRH